MSKEKIPSDPLILVDGSSYLFRAYYALPPLSNSKGLPTGAIYGVINMLRNLLDTYNPSQIAVVFDTKEKNFRHKIYPGYKANRTEMPEDLVPQIKPLHNLIKAMGIPLIAIPGIEADDVIGVLAVEAAKDNKFVLISTGDKDMAQLVNENIMLVNTMNDSFMDRAGVIKKFELPPEQIIDYLSLVGDSVDNIPGVEKVGPKTAVKWLKEYNNLDNLIKNADSIKGKVGENLRASLDKLDLYRKLTTIDTGIKIDFSIKKIHKEKPNIDKLKEMFADLEFKTWLKNAEEIFGKNYSVKNKSSKVTKTAQKRQESIKSKYELILTEKDLSSLIAKLEKSEIFAFDTETNSLNAIDANIVGMSFAINEGIAYYLPVNHNYDAAPKQLELDHVIKNLKPILENKFIAKIGHNFKYDIEVIQKYDLNLKGSLHDTMLQSYLLNSIAGKHDMDSVALRELGVTTISYEDVAGSGKKQITFNKVELDVATEYAAEDADITLKLHNVMYPRLRENADLLEVYNSIEMPLVKVLVAMESQGVFVDKGILSKISKDLGKKLDKLSEKITTLAGEEFNINSPKQLQEILFNKLGLPILQKTPTGQASTAESVLQDLSSDYELPKEILEYRSTSKLKSTYSDKLPEKINSRTGRIHTSYHQAVTATGRLSSTDPNLQNIPIRTEDGRKIRKAFVAENNNVILSADYSQIELRIMAHLSDDNCLVTTFNNGEDVHQATAAEILGKAIESVTTEERRRAKAINFGLIYGMSAYGLSKQLGIERSAAQEYIDSYFDKFPGVFEYMEQTREKARKSGFVETMYGRRLYLPDINSKNYPRRQAAERAAINAPMQGAQSDIIKLAMIKIQGWIEAEGLQSDIKMIMQVHDELVFEIKNSKTILELSKQTIPEMMGSVASLKVPLLVGVGVGSNWEDSH